MIEKIREIVKKEVPLHDWKFHVSIVVKHSIQLAKLFEEDEEMAEIAALLHDIGGFRRGWENHEVKGAEEAEKILKDLNYSEETIEKIKHCILSHRSDGPSYPETKLAKILRDADALSHFDAVPYLLYVGLYRNNNDVEKAMKWVRDKLERDYNEKICLPESKKIAKEKYEAAKLILN